MYPSTKPVGLQLIQHQILRLSVSPKIGGLRQVDLTMSGRTDSNRALQVSDPMRIRFVFILLLDID